MGNGSSVPPPPPPPPANVAPVAPIVTLPVGRAPVQDGASGLHYSGRVYTNDFQKLGGNVCNGLTVGVDAINDVYPNGVSSPDLPVDSNTHRISASALHGYVNNLINSALIPGQSGSFDEQVAADAAFYAAIKDEYCFYEARYTAALAQFLALISDPHGSNDGQKMLDKTVQLNQRLNSLLEIMHYIGNDRAQKVNVRSPEIVKANDDLQKKINTLSKQKHFLESSDVKIQTQREMMRFSAEKGRAMNIQIMFFVALNVVALGSVIAVYKMVPSASPSV